MATSMTDRPNELREALERRVREWERPMPSPAKSLLLALSALCALLFVAACVYAAVHLRALPDSVQRAADPKTYDFHFYKQARASRAALLLLFASLGLLAVARWERFVRLMRVAWLAAGHPMNLAIYRIVLFATILFNLDNDNGKTQILLFAGLPKELLVPPTGMEHLLEQQWFRDLMNPTVALWAYYLMNTFCVTAILGIFTRTSAALASLCFVYAAGIPQCFGQCNHFHHMFWFGAILASSRCGDYLSIDALLKARRQADKTGVTAPPAPSWAYALPLRFVWVGVSFCYFFPGLWKYWNAGLAWAFSDHFKHLAEWKWINMGLEMKDGAWQGDWHPLFRLDKYSILYQPAAMTALIFEISFPILIFFPRLRYLSAAMGVGFHRMIAFTMRIPFFTLQTSYVAFVEWDRLFAWLGRGSVTARLTRRLVVLLLVGVAGLAVISQLAGLGLFEPGTYYILSLVGVIALAFVPEAAPIVFAYDGNNPSARRSVAMLRSLDLRGNVEYRDDAPAAAGAQTTVKGMTLTGAAALRALAARNPLLWIVWPLTYAMLPEPTATADAPPAGAAPVTWGPKRMWPVLMMGAVILLPNLYLGAKRQYHGWPFACYPLFEKIRTHVKPDFDVIAFDADGKMIPWDEKRMMDLLTRPRYSTMCRRVRENQDPPQMQAFWKMLVDQNPDLKQAQVVQFRIRTRLTAPEQFATVPPVKDDLVYQVRVSPTGEVTPDPTAVLSRVRSARSDD